jgi:hypothetical protein
MLSIGRPSGYVDPGKSAQAAAQASQALNQFQAGGGAAAPGPMFLPAGLPPPPVMSFVEPGLSQVVTPFCCVTGMVTADVLQDQQEYMDVSARLAGWGGAGRGLAHALHAPGLHAAAAAAAAVCAHLAADSVVVVRQSARLAVPLLHVLAAPVGPSAPARHHALCVGPAAAGRLRAAPPHAGSVPGVAT